MQQKVIKKEYKHKSNSVFSNKRNVDQPQFANIDGLFIDERQKMDGLSMLGKIDSNTIPLVFFDPQYRAILDKQNYGNEGENRGKKRAELPQMNEEIIGKFVKEIERILIPKGHLMLWVDKYILCEGFDNFVSGTKFETVDLITWNKDRMGMGYRTRRFSEHLIIFQKPPKRAKGVWRVHDIPDVWTEKIENGDRNHVHSKPVGLQKKLIEAVTNKGDIVVDPAAGGYSVMKSALEVNRHFLGCDILQ
jgi:site-specific DNA-methyltransferase (adenine-specific)